MEFSGPAVFAVARSPSKMKRVDYMITSNFWFVSTSQHIWNFSLSYRFKSKYLDVHPISCHDFSASILKSHQFQLHPLHPGKTVSNLYGSPELRCLKNFSIFDTPNITLYALQSELCSAGGYRHVSGNEIPMRWVFSGVPQSTPDNSGRWIRDAQGN